MEHENAIQTLATERYLLSEMTPAERDSFEEHYFECASCAEDVRLASQFLGDAREVWAAEQRAAPVVKVQPQPESKWNWLAWLQPQFAAPAMAALLILAGVSTVGTMSLRRQLAEVSQPRVIAATALRPETRGEPVVLLAGEGSSVAVQFDLPDNARSSFHYAIRSASGETVFGVNGGAEQAGERVTLSIPRFEIPAGRYVLTVSGSTTPGQPETEVARYPFEVRQP
jgi:hypothetical protein